LNCGAPSRCVEWRTTTSAEVDDERLSQWHDCAAVDGLRHHKTFDEADGVEKAGKEYDVGYETVEKCDSTGPRDWFSWIRFMVSGILGSRRAQKLARARSKGFVRRLICS
jgi:hypothetical protein